MKKLVFVFVLICSCGIQEPYELLEAIHQSGRKESSASPRTEDPTDPVCACPETLYPLTRGRQHVKVMNPEYKETNEGFIDIAEDLIVLRYLRGDKEIAVSFKPKRKFKASLID